MALGNQVIFYQSGNVGDEYVADDNLAFVLAEGEGWVDLVVFPPGGPVQFVRAREWDADSPYNVVGGYYWREDGTEPPDLNAYFHHYNRTEMAALAARQRRELEATPAHEREAVTKRHVDERNALILELDKKYPEAKE